MARQEDSAAPPAVIKTRALPQRQVVIDRPDYPPLPSDLDGPVARRLRRRLMHLRGW